MLISPEGKQYIGRTTNLKNRMAHYEAKANADRSPIYREIAKYGFENFKRVILKEIESETLEELNVKLNDAEKSFIEEYDTVDNGLNRNRYDTTIRIYKCTDEARKHYSEGQKGRKHSLESRMKRAKENAYQSKKVYSEKLGMTFCSLREAAHYVGVSNGCKVSEAISGARKSCGVDPKTGQRIDDWCYV